MNIKKLSILCAASVLVISGCASTGTKDDSVADEALTNETISEEGGSSSVSNQVGVDDASTESDVNANTTTSLLNEHIIYFEYDSTQLKDTTQDIINAHAEFLLSNPEQQITLEGHADERGTREYNLALGEKRANVVKRALMFKGVQRSQINSISFGEEKPQVDSHSEEAWSSNRRAVFVYAANE